MTRCKLSLRPGLALRELDTSYALPNLQGAAAAPTLMGPPTAATAAITTAVITAATAAAASVDAGQVVTCYSCPTHTHTHTMEASELGPRS